MKVHINYLQLLICMLFSNTHQTTNNQSKYFIYYMKRHFYLSIYLIFNLFNKHLLFYKSTSKSYINFRTKINKELMKI